LAKGKLEKGVQHSMKWRPISWKMVHSVASATFLAVFYVWA